MKLSELIEKLNPLEVKGDLNKDITGVNIDSRQVKEGHLFIAVKGTQVDGHEEPEESVVAKNETEDTETATEAADNEAIKRYVEDEEDEDEFGEISLKSILGGDILQSKFFVRQVIFVLFVVALMLAYTANRYNSQQEIITIDSLKLKLQEERYNVLTQSSELLNLSRQSNIEVKLPFSPSLHSPLSFCER